MKLVAQILIATLPSAMFVAADENPPLDRIRDALDASLTQHDLQMEAATSAVVAALEQAKERARKTGNLDLHQSLEKELQSFQRDRTLPTSVSTTAYTRSTKRALSGVEDAYETAIREYTKASQIEIAKELQSELAEIHKAGYITVDLVRVGTVWANDDPPMRLTILRRSGDTFQARFQVGPKIDRYITGTTDKKSLSWLAKDVAVKTGGGPGGDNTGVIVRGESGTRLDMTWSGPGAASGKFTLQLVPR